jgi:hypothetical protein
VSRCIHVCICDVWVYLNEMWCGICYMHLCDWVEYMSLHIDVRLGMVGKTTVRPGSWLIKACDLLELVEKVNAIG